MKKIFTLTLCCLGMTVFAQEQTWSPARQTVSDAELFAGTTKPSAFRLFSLDEQTMFNRLKAAPLENTQAARSSSLVIEFPNEAGVMERFSVVEAPVMDASLAARYPGIYSYAGNNIDVKGSTIRLDVSPQGLHATIFYTGKSTNYIDPIGTTGRSYIVVSRKDLPAANINFQCLTTGAAPQTSPGNEILRNADDGTLRTYRLALCASGEYSQFWLNGTETSDAQRKAKVLAAQNSQMTRANAIFERDFGLRLVLVANNDAVIYLNASSDPWTSNFNSVTQTTCDNVIGNANYDIGHLVHRASDNGNAGCIGCVCRTGSKGSGFTSYTNLADERNFVVDYLTHEMGHQLGGNHTFTHSNEGTIAQVEPGSGSTIMGYAGITGATTDVQPHSDDYFHALTIQQVTNYIKSSSGSCSQNTLTGNSAPLANAGANYTIPKGTPFTLTGSGSDADAGDLLRYNWEQIDARATGSSTVPSATATAGPQFRSYNSQLGSSRTFPALASILNGTNTNKWEVLPTVARTLNFRLTVRDNHAGGGNNASDDMILTISSASGPFSVTAPNTAVTWPAGSSQTVTWNVASSNLSPVNCTAVNILLSSDGGQTFPVTLAAATTNDGSETIVVPSTSGTSFRIKVESVGNIFFDISNTNFSIGAAVACAAPAGLNATNVTTASATLNWSASASALSYDVEYLNGSTWTPVVTGTTAVSANLTGLSQGTSYQWRVRSNCSSESSSFATSSFTTSSVSSTCPGEFDTQNNGTLSGAAPIQLDTDIKGTINVRNDQDYYGFTAPGGNTTITLGTLPANYQLSLLNAAGTQLAVSQNNGTISETISGNLSAGNYYARVFPKGNASNASSCYTLRVSSGSGRPGISQPQFTKMTALPNPAISEIKLSVPYLKLSADVRITDQAGRVVNKTIVTKQVQSLDVSSLKPGMYIITVRSGDTTESIRFIKL